MYPLWKTATHSSRPLLEVAVRALQAHEVVEMATAGEGEREATLMGYVAKDAVDSVITRLHTNGRTPQGGTTHHSNMTQENLITEEPVRVLQTLCMKVEKVGEEGVL